MRAGREGCRCPPAHPPRRPPPAEAVAATVSGAFCGSVARQAVRKPTLAAYLAKQPLPEGVPDIPPANWCCQVLGRAGGVPQT